MLPQSPSGPTNLLIVGTKISPSMKHPNVFSPVVVKGGNSSGKGFFSHDIVINTIGPFYKFGNIILKAAIQAKKPYVDICDDWKPTLEMLDLKDDAIDGGITAIIGMGSSPGISNLMSVLACSEFDMVDEIITAWGFGQTKMGKKPKFFITLHIDPIFPSNCGSINMIFILFIKERMYLTL